MHGRKLLFGFGAFCAGLAIFFSFLIAGGGTREFTNSAIVSEPVVIQSIADQPVRRLFNLQNSVSKHRTPDAIVMMPPTLDVNAPMHLLVYNHGLMNNLDEAMEIWQIEKDMITAPPNTVLLLPEWAYNPEAYSSNAGKFHSPGFFRKMANEAFAQIPELQGATLDTFEEITIASFSGGFRAARTEIEQNGIEDKVVRLVLLDSLYETAYFDAWLKRHLAELAAGRIQYWNFYNDTARNSLPQLNRLKQMIADAGMTADFVYVDNEDSEAVLLPSVVAKYPVVFKRSTLFTPELTQHQHVAKEYFPVALKAVNQRSTTRMASADRDAEPRL